MNNKKITLALIAVAVMTGAAFAQSDAGFNNTYVVLSINGGASSYYTEHNAPDGFNPTFSGTNFGVFNPGLGQSLVLNGGEANTYKLGTDLNNVQGHYAIALSSDPAPILSSYSTFNIAYNSDTGGGGGYTDQKWQTANLTIDLLSGLSNGIYTLYAYNSAFTADFPTAGANTTITDGGPYTATFTVVPEPSTLALLAGPAILGALFFVRRRRA